MVVHLAGYAFDFLPVWEGLPRLFDGLVVTVILTVVVMILSLPLGLLVGFARLGRFRLGRAVAYAYTELFRTTPLLVQIFFVFFALPVVLKINFDSFTAAADEASASRIFAGQHFRYDEDAGQSLGAQVADFVVDRALSSPTNHQGAFRLHRHG